LGRLGGSPEPEAGAGPVLTPREVAVLALVSTGATNAEVGCALDLAEGTVKAYLHAVTTKLGTQSCRGGSGGAVAGPDPLTRTRRPPQLGWKPDTWRAEIVGTNHPISGGEYLT
jgi:DNA-binding CsgD family transcriptional regulator